LTGIDLSPDEVSSLHHGTEGWIAGLQLAALTLRGRQVGTDGNPLVSGRQRFIADYLAEDVLDPLQTGIQDFLLKTSLLDRLCGSLCDTVTGKEGGQEVLEML
jgi:LuxR family maltose regulon positive regulatory protein